MTIEGVEYPEQQTTLSIWIAAANPGELPILIFSSIGKRGVWQVDGNRVEISPAIHFSTPITCTHWRSLVGLRYDEKSPIADMSAWLVQPQHSDIERFRFSILELNENRFLIECSVHMTINDFTDQGHLIHLRTYQHVDFEGIDVAISSNTSDAAAEADSILSAVMQSSALSTPLVYPRLDPTSHEVLAYEVHYEPTTTANQG